MFYLKINAAKPGEKLRLLHLATTEHLEKRFLL